MDFNRWLQSRLTAHGFAVGAIDGIVGPNTVGALRAFQSANGLRSTGQADEATVANLRRQASAITPQQQAAIGNIDVEQPAETLPAIVRDQWPRQSGVPARFGAVGTDQVQIDPAYAMYLAWAKSTPVRRITVHRLIAPAVERALQTVANTYSMRERESLGLHLFGGSLNVRRMRGGSNYSMHSWGIALDFDPERNGLMTRAPQARLSHPDADAFWNAWKAEGALPLGQAIGRDFMHLQFARL